MADIHGHGAKRMREIAANYAENLAGAIRRAVGAGDDTAILICANLNSRGLKTARGECWTAVRLNNAIFQLRLRGLLDGVALNVSNRAEGSIAIKAASWPEHARFTDMPKEIADRDRAGRLPARAVARTLGGVAHYG